MVPGIPGIPEFQAGIRDDSTLDGEDEGWEEDEEDEETEPDNPAAASAAEAWETLALVMLRGGLSITAVKAKLTTLKAAKDPDAASWSTTKYARLRELAQQTKISTSADEDAD